MNASQYFPETYQAGRARFRDLARQAGGALHAIDHPVKGPDGGALSMDAAWFGPADPAKALLLVSATHGVEGHCGSGCQAGWLASGGPGRLPADTGALVIHAVNPHGFAWTRRVTPSKSCFPGLYGIADPVQAIRRFRPPTDMSSSFGPKKYSRGRRGKAAIRMNGSTQPR